MDNRSKILIIDDEDIVLDSCCQILKNGTFDIATAKNGEEGLEVLKEFKPDLVYVDLKMPGISGFEVLDQIHEFDPTIVTIVITGFATVSSAVEAMKKGTYDFLPKPFTPDELRLITKRGLERRELILETITLRREKEMLREHFSAIISHEIKSPLGALQQNLYVFSSDLSEKLTEAQKTKLKQLQSRIDDLIKMVNTWLRAISVDISSIREKFSPITVSKVVEKAIEDVKSHAIRKSIDIHSTMPEDQITVIGDEVTLVEAVVNILSNAVKYSRIDNTVHLDVKRQVDQVLISVKDHGVGIAQDDLPHIFEDFYTGKTKAEGERRSGVGLSITRRIIEAHDGTISVDSELGKGSTFVIQLPVVKIL